ncbi:hypothetical protein K440DRAFT_633896 [Wilcoxina mikolae CBS 423.85]|nr:hypothetical protein K440DRAFT_633896 [Wilcoxina mikolae CBS 423.85]
MTSRASSHPSSLDQSLSYTVWPSFQQRPTPVRAARLRSIQVKSSIRLPDRGFTSPELGLVPITLVFCQALALCSRLQRPTPVTDSSD